MRLLFSGAKYLGTEQKEANLSLGGFMSGTPVPNSKLNAIFSDVSLYDLQNKVNNCLALFIQNETTNLITNLTIQEVYERFQGAYTNFADFDFAVVEVAPNGSIEAIGSIYEEPFYAEWFNSESRLEDCRLTLTQSGTIGDTFSIFGINGTLTGDSLATFQADLIEALNDSGLFSASKIDDNTVYIQNSVFGITGVSSNFSTSGSALATNVNLSGGLLDKTLIADEIVAGGSIGLWIRRRINSNYKIQDDECLTLEEIKAQHNTKEDFKIIFELD